MSLGLRTWKPILTDQPTDDANAGAGVATPRFDVPDGPRFIDPGVDDIRAYNDGPAIF